MYCPFSMYWSQAQLCQYAAPAIFPISHKDLPARHKFITLLWLYILSLFLLFSPLLASSPRLSFRHLTFLLLHSFSLPYIYFFPLSVHPTTHKYPVFYNCKRKTKGRQFSDDILFIGRNWLLFIFPVCMQLSAPRKPSNVPKVKK